MLVLGIFNKVIYMSSIPPNRHLPKIVIENFLEILEQNEAAECPICLESMIDLGPEKDLNTTSDQKIHKTVCNHFFHTDCIRKCLQDKSECPTCRHEIQNLTQEQEVWSKQIASVREQANALLQAKKASASAAISASFLIHDETTILSERAKEKQKRTFSNMSSSLEDVEGDPESKRRRLELADELYARRVQEEMLSLELDQIAQDEAYARSLAEQFNAEVTNNQSVIVNPASTTIATPQQSTPVRRDQAIYLPIVDNRALATSSDEQNASSSASSSQLPDLTSSLPIAEAPKVVTQPPNFSTDYKCAKCTRTILWKEFEDKQVARSPSSENMFQHIDICPKPWRAVDTTCLECFKKITHDDVQNNNVDHFFRSNEGSYKHKNPCS